MARYRLHQYRFPAPGGLLSLESETPLPRRQRIVGQTVSLPEPKPNPDIRFPQDRTSLLLIEKSVGPASITSGFPPRPLIAWHLQSRAAGKPHTGCDAPAP